MWKQTDSSLPDDAWVLLTVPVSKLNGKVKDKLTLLLGSVKPLCWSISKIAQHPVVGRISNAPSMRISLYLESFLYGCEDVGHCDTKLVPNCVVVAMA